MLEISMKNQISVLGKDLKPGDLIIDQGLVIGVDINGCSKFWEEPNYSYYDLNDCVYGSLSGPLKLEQTFIITRDKKDVLAAFKIVDYELLSHTADVVEWRKNFKDVMSGVFDDKVKEKHKEK